MKRRLMIKRLGYYLSRPGYYLSVAYYDIPFRIFFSILILKLLLFDYIIGLGTLSFAADFGVILIMLAFSLVIKNRTIKITYLLFINLACSLIFFVNSLYRSFFQDFASAYSIKQMPQLIKVVDSVIHLIDKEYFFLADFIFLPFLLLKLKKKYDFNIVDRICTFGILLILGLYCNLSMLSDVRSGMKFFNFWGEKSILMQHTGIIDYQILDMYFFLLTEIRKESVEQTEVDTVKAWFQRGYKQKSTINAFTHLGEGDNVIIIQVESLQNFIIGKKYNSNEITPNLNKLAKGGIYFNNIYDQTASGNSSDATLLANTSLYPSQRGAASFLYAQNCFDSLPKVLKEHGYTSAILYPYVSSFWNSATFDKAIGFEHQFYQNDFVMEENIGLGLSDRAFLSQSLEKIRRLSTPFYVSLRTLTNHFPYYYVTKDIDSFPIGAMEGKTIGYYMRSTHYVDSAIGEFLQKLSENDLRSNTIIVIYGDHRARLTEDDLKSIGVYDISETHKIPVIISLANRRQGETRDTIGGLIDIAPTICNILGIDISDRFFMGRDLGYGDNSFAIFRDGSYICEDESMNKLTAQQQLMISDSILEKDIVRLLSDKQRCLMP